MWNTFKYTVLSVIRERNIIIWVMLFPLILSTVFNVMFRGIEEQDLSVPDIPIAIVDESTGGASEPFRQTIEAISGDDGLPIIATYVDSQDEATALLKEKKTIGTITLDAQGHPDLALSPAEDEAGISMERISRTALADVVTNYSRSRAAIEDIAATNPGALADSAVIDSLTSGTDYMKEVSMLHGSMTGARYFYALLGFAALMAASVALQAVGNLQSNLSALGARRTLGGTSRARALAGTLGASWIVSLGALLVAFAYIRWVLGVEFGGRDWACILGLAASALLATALGALVASLPGIPLPGKSGLLTGIVIFTSLFAGLYGDSSMNIADQVARDTPWLATINPTKQVTNLFYTLYVYTDMEPFFRTLGVVMALTSLYALAAAFFMRRQQHASI